MNMKVSYEDVKNNEEVNALIERGNEVLKTMGYTEHSKTHATKVAVTAGSILEQLGYNEREIELAKIAGYMHDIGNSINRYDHAQSGALLAYQILKDMGMPLEDILYVITAIGNHDEGTGTAIDVISAALILGDKTDVRRNRVQNNVMSTFDIHDRVNYSVLSSDLEIDAENKVIQMNMEIDSEIYSVMEYFEIFLGRMVMSKKAAQVLGCTFKLVANGSQLC